MLAQVKTTLVPLQIKRLDPAISGLSISGKYSYFKLNELFAHDMLGHCLGVIPKCFKELGIIPMDSRGEHFASLNEMIIRALLRAEELPSLDRVITSTSELLTNLEYDFEDAVYPTEKDRLQVIKYWSKPSNIKMAEKVIFIQKEITNAIDALSYCF